MDLYRKGEQSTGELQSTTKTEVPSNSTDPIENDQMDSQNIVMLWYRLHASNSEI